MSSPKTLARLISKFEMSLFPPQPPPATSRSLTPMDQKHYHDSYNPDYKTLFYADHRAFNQYPSNPTYQTTLPDPTAVPPMQSEYVWDIRNVLQQTSTSLPTIPFTEGDCLLVSSQPIWFYPTQPQVSPSASSIFGSIGAICFSTPGRHTQKRQYRCPFRTPRT